MKLSKWQRTPTVRVGYGARLVSPVNREKKLAEPRKR